MNWQNDFRSDLFSSPIPRAAHALSVVVYRFPGPEDDEILNHAADVASGYCRERPIDGLGYLTLVESDFDRLYSGLERGDAIGAAFSVLSILGPSTLKFIENSDDFIFGWISISDRQYGEALLLQILQRPPLLN